MTTAVMLTKNQAKALTERIQAAGTDFAALLLEAHDGEAWRALGYATWGDYVAGEFTFSCSRSYQLLAAAKVEKATGERVPSRLAEHVVQHVGHDAPSEAMQRALAEQRAAPIPKPKSHSRAVHGLDGLLSTLRRLAEQLETIADERTEDDALPPDLVRLVQRNVDVMQRLLA